MGTMRTSGGSVSVPKEVLFSLSPTIYLFIYSVRDICSDN